MAEVGVVKDRSLIGARRRVTALYTGARGWMPARGRVRLDVATARALRREGVTMVRVRASLWRTRELSLSRYLLASERFGVPS
jgi:hypothetical protein